MEGKVSTIELSISWKLRSKVSYGFAGGNRALWVWLATEEIHTIGPPKVISPLNVCYMILTGCYSFSSTKREREQVHMIVFDHERRRFFFFQPQTKAVRKAVKQYIPLHQLLSSTN